MLKADGANGGAQNGRALLAPLDSSTLALRAQNAALRALTIQTVRTPSFHALTARDEPG